MGALNERFYSRWASFGQQTGEEDGETIQTKLGVTVLNCHFGFSTCLGLAFATPTSRTSATKGRVKSVPPWYNRPPQPLV